MRSCGELLCGGATGECRACRGGVGGGVGGGVRNAPTSRAHAGKLGFMGPAIWRRNQPNQVFFFVFRVATSPRARRSCKKFADGKKTFLIFIRLALIRRVFFFILYRTYLNLSWGLVRAAEIRGIFTRLSKSGEVSPLKVGCVETKPWDTTLSLRSYEIRKFFPRFVALFLYAASVWK